MKYIADLHIHSPFSRATSKKSNLPGLFAWAQVKGINLVGTGDFTHPGWFSSLKENLEPAEPGFFRLKDENVPTALDNIIPTPIPVRFALTSEISCIYKRNQKVRKIHTIIYVPDFKSAENINAKLAGIGNIESDGRPILGLDTRHLLEILLEQAPEGFMVPAHIWTPWFSLFGSKSGFDTIEECFGDLTLHIFALETGLSSDPDMNRLISSLDQFTMISNSDCHSPANLGREANLFDTGFDFFSMRDALKNNRDKAFVGTIEFFPEEGKYHFDGHRKCNVCLDPEDTRKINAVCPVCNNPLTVGVMHRVMELANRKKPYYPDRAPIFKSLIPLPEVLSEIIGTGAATKGVLAQYARVISLFGSDFNLFLNVPIEEIRQKYSTPLGEAIKRIRNGNVIRKPGYDGEFGVIKVFNDRELDLISGQLSLFKEEKQLLANNKKLTDRRHETFQKQTIIEQSNSSKKKNLNPEQLKVVQSNAKRLLVSAGPGTGKTFTLVARLAQLLSIGKRPAGRFTAITFTNRAAQEIRERLLNEIGPQANEVFIGTFHSFCLKWLRKDEPNLTVVGDEARSIILRKLFPKMNTVKLVEFQNMLSDFFHFQVIDENYDQCPNLSDIQKYIDELNRQNGIDLEAVIPYFIRRLTTTPDLLKKMNQMVNYMFVDEFQDLNSSQYKLVKLFAEKADVFAIGDPNQAIYGFRGSNPNFFYRFSDECNATILSLTRNYRSAPTIIEAAKTVISNNAQRNREILIPHCNHKTLIEHYLASTPDDEADFIASRIEDLMGGTHHLTIHSRQKSINENCNDKSLADIAILYRLNLQSDILQKTLDKKGIPFQMVDAIPFFMGAETKAAYYWIRVATNHDVFEFISLLKEIKGIGNSTLRKLEREISFDNYDLLNLVGKVDLSSNLHKKLREIIDTIDCFTKKVKIKGLAASLNNIMPYLAIEPEQPSAKRLIELAGVFGKDLSAFSHHLKQNSVKTVYDDRAEAVSIMTLHAAKGLEFPVVFITGLEEGLLPCNISGLSSNLEEERRLFYVGLTRAQESLILSSSTTRTLFGKTNSQSISRFVNEIPPHLMKKTSQTKKNRKKTSHIQLTLFDD